jgi:hypothetical protein
MGHDLADGHACWQESAGLWLTSPGSGQAAFKAEQFVLEAQRQFLPLVPFVLRKPAKLVNQCAHLGCEIPQFAPDFLNLRFVLLGVFQQSPQPSRKVEEVAPPGYLSAFNSASMARVSALSRLISAWSRCIRFLA